MTMEPASTRANRINSDSLDWSYIAISLMVGHSISVWRARGRSTADTPSAPTRWPQMAVRQCLRDIRVRLETDSQKDDVRLDRFREFFGNDRGSDRGRSGCKALRVARGCNGYFNALSGKRLGKSVADLAEANNCVAHDDYPILRSD